jgi:hypothetical protein
MDRYALLSVLLGAALLLLGILGFIWNPLFGVFRENPLYLLILLASSWLLIWAGMWAGPRAVRIVGQIVGVCYLLLAVLGFILPGLMANIFGMNSADIWLNAFVAILGLDIGFGWV